jgi:LmbE family N-acetylglucosaminyl deacetylase
MIAPGTASASTWHRASEPWPPERAVELGTTLVVAPHPDDEALGCGGVIVLLRRAGLPVRVVVVSDGAASHPGSARYPPPVLGALRRSESLAGLGLLGVKPDDVTFLGLPDGAVPGADAPDGRHAVELARDVLLGWPDVLTVLLPWRRDPHDDHRAAWSLFSAALDTIRSPVRRLEYPIWTMVHPAPDDLPRPGEARLLRLDVGPVLVQKRSAIQAHRSQTTAMIDDATIGHCLTEPVLEQLTRPWELLFEVGEVGEVEP